MQFYYSGRMFEACLPFGPVVTSKETRWFSCSDLKPLDWIAEKCANRSSPPSSGVIKPKPLESLNHFTIPVAITFPISVNLGLRPVDPLKPERNDRQILHY